MCRGMRFNLALRTILSQQKTQKNAHNKNQKISS